jgi:hypothetical protein
MTNWFTRDVTPDEERAIASFMTRLAAAPTPETSVAAGPGTIWWKAQLLRRWDEQRQAVRPLAVMEPVQLVAGLTAAALVFLWALPSLTRAATLLFGSVTPIA